MILKQKQNKHNKSTTLTKFHNSQCCLRSATEMCVLICFVISISKHIDDDFVSNIFEMACTSFCGILLENLDKSKAQMN